MFPPVRTRDPAAVEAEVQEAFKAMFENCDLSVVSDAFEWITLFFTGGHEHYQALDARYHDFEHTMQGTLCMIRLLRGRHETDAQPRLDKHSLQLGLLAVLMHDTGYLKDRDDTNGTGAKYTVTHVARSAEFAGHLLREKGFPATDVQAVQNMIRCTGVDTKLDAIPFQNELEQTLGFALATGDLLGQMAAADYIEKLPILYSEFAEASRFAKGSSHFIASFSSADDLMRRTPAFWKEFVLKKIDKDFGGLYRFLNQPYPNGANEYLDRIEANIARLRKQNGDKGAAILG